MDFLSWSLLDVEKLQEEHLTSPWEPLFPMEQDAKRMEPI
jgi:hypothetical protein